jgi:hypothetical protein
MPQLPKKKARQVENAASGFELLPDGIYRAMLVSVTAKDGKPPPQGKGPYWSWEFKVTEEGAPARRLWLNTSLSDEAAWKMKEAFDAFGVPADTHTDELEGEEARLVVGSRTIATGPRRGEPDNQIEQVLPLLDEGIAASDDEEDEEDEEDEDEPPGDGDDEEEEESDEESEPPPPPPTSRARSSAKAKSGAAPPARSATSPAPAGNRRAASPSSPSSRRTLARRAPDVLVDDEGNPIPL